MTDTTTTAEIVIDVDRALALLREVIAEHGAAAVYTPPFGGESQLCLYSHGDAPSCLVGHALHRAGITIPELDQMEGEIRDLLWAPRRLHLTGDALRVLGVAQDVQDTGGTWGQALADAVVEAAALAGGELGA